MRKTTAVALSLLAGTAVAGGLAGCSTAADSASGETAADSVPTTGSGSGAGSTGGTGSYTDGTYSENGSYLSPAGKATITVKVTIADDVVTAVTVKGAATDPTAKRYQSAFEDGISSVVVGKRIDSLKVSKVGGSSLTSEGFNAAITKILADAGA